MARPPLQKNYIDPHVPHMCSHMVCMCGFNCTRLPTCEIKCSHMKHMWGQSNTCGYRLSTHACDTYDRTCELVWVGSCALTCGKNMRNYNNIQNPHVKMSCDFSVTASFMLVRWFSLVHHTVSISVCYTVCQNDILSLHIPLLTSCMMWIKSSNQVQLVHVSRCVERNA